jgi:Helicase conserved C-terminal domain
VAPAGWKALVETLFQQGLIKVVFATETLAAGINMPARTTIISSISRRRNGEYAMLPHNDLLQMAGRAGRRGYDTQGHCVVAQTRCAGSCHRARMLGILGHRAHMLGALFSERTHAWPLRTHARQRMPLCGTLHNAVPSANLHLSGSCAETAHIPV